MILDNLINFDKDYDELMNKLDFNADYALSENIINAKMSLLPFLEKHLIDCFTYFDPITYADIIIEQNKVGWFSKKHSKKDFIKFIGSVNKTL